MVVFPNFSNFYDTWRKDLEGKGVKVRLNTEVTQVVKRDKTGVVVRTIRRTPVKDHHNPASAWAPEDPTTNDDAGADDATEEYDELVLCVLTDTAKRLLGKTASFREKKVLGSAKFANDITITHNDTEYMKKHYENFYDEDKAVTNLSGVDQTARCEFAKKDFKPMYLIKSYSDDRSKLEMCFDCTNYQAQFPPQVDFDNHVFRSIQTRSLGRTGGTSCATRTLTTCSLYHGCGCYKAASIHASQLHGHLSMHTKSHVSLVYLLQSILELITLRTWRGTSLRSCHSGCTTCCSMDHGTGERRRRRARRAPAASMPVVNMAVCIRDRVLKTRTGTCGERSELLGEAGRRWGVEYSTCVVIVKFLVVVRRLNKGQRKNELGLYIFISLTLPSLRM
jgi:hypothetical protein